MDNYKDPAAQAFAELMNVVTGHFKSQREQKRQEALDRLTYLSATGGVPTISEETPRPSPDFIGPQPARERIASFEEFFAGKGITIKPQLQNRYALNPLTKQMEFIGEIPKGSGVTTIPTEKDVFYKTPEGKVYDAEGKQVEQVSPNALVVPKTDEAKPRKLPSPQLTAINQLMDTISKAETLKSMSETGKYKTGPMALMYSDLPGASTFRGIKATPEEANFKALLQDFSASYITSKTGAQRGFKEMQWLESAMPNWRMAPNQFQKVSDGVISQLEKNLNTMIKNAKSAGYDLSDLGVETTNEKQPQPTKNIKVGGKIMVDDKGNKAIVFPDGTYKEMGR